LGGTTLRISSGNHALRSPPAAARRKSAWRRRLAIGLALLAIAFLAVAEHARSDIADPGKRGIIAALKGRIVAALEDPLALLDERSPGRRGPGALHLTKSGARPHERVLADVRQREPGPDLAPGAEPVALVDIAPAAVAPPAAPPRDSTGIGGDGYLMPGIIGAPLGFPEFPGAFPGGPAILGMLPGTAGNPGSPNAPPGTGGGPNLPPGNTGNPDSPNSPPGNADTPPGGSPPGGGSPTTISIPEPATWLLMTLGLIVLLAMRRPGLGRTD
jgi:hypothetical protein